MGMTSKPNVCTLGVVEVATTKNNDIIKRKMVSTNNTRVYLKK
jgi:hypothetical protein